MRLFFKSGGFTGILNECLHPELQVVYFSRIQGEKEDVARLTSSHRGEHFYSAMIEHFFIVINRQPVEFSTLGRSWDYDLSIQEDLSEVPRFDLD